MKPLRLFTLATAVAALLPAVSFADTGKTEVILKSDIQFDALNPARGDKSPKAGTIWGDRKAKGPTGFLLKPSDGFESPPHIHNISYRGIVIKGKFHNDDPKAEGMWMSTGSFWKQPKGEVHITAAKGEETIAYIEIDEGPYLVLPSKEAFHTDEHALNVEKSNITWVGASDIVWLDQADKTNGAKVSFLWGDRAEGKLNGTMVKLPAGFHGEIRSHGTSFRAIVVDGLPQYIAQDKTQALEPGSSFASEGEAVHDIASAVDKESIVYVRTNGKFEILSK